MTTAQVDRIVVGVTGSLANLAALHAAVAQARRSARPLVAVHAWLPVGGEIAYRRGPCPPLLEIWRQRARDTLRCSFVDAFGGIPSDASITCVILRGEPGPTLVAAASHPNDLLVVGSGRRGHLASFRYGSVSRYCFTRACCPVLAVPPPAMISELRSSRLTGRARDVIAVDESASHHQRS